MLYFTFFYLEPLEQKHHSFLTSQYFTFKFNFVPTGQNVLLATVKKRCLRCFGHVWNMADSRRVLQKYLIPHKNRTKIAHASRGGTRSWEILNKQTLLVRWCHA